MDNNEIPIECPDCGSRTFSKVNRRIETVNLKYNPNNSSGIVVGGPPRSVGDYLDTEPDVMCSVCHTQWETHEELEEEVSLAHNEEAPLEADK